MQAVLDGYKDQAIARRLGISVITVRRRVGRFIRYVGAKNRIQAVVVGVLKGWLEFDIDDYRGRHNGGVIPGDQQGNPAS